MEVVIRPMAPADWPAVAEIYRQGIETKNATFQTQLPTYEEWDRGHLKSCRFVALAEGQVAGWAALSPTSSRPVYRGVVEISLYVGEGFRGLGMGGRLMEAIIAASEAEGIWTIQGSTFETNQASLALQRRYGFRVVGIRERIAQLDGVWRNTVFTERRSPVVGK